MATSMAATREGYLYENYHYFHLRDTAGQERSFHFHEFEKLVLLRSGKVDYLVEDVSYTLQPGSILLVPNHAIHRAIIDQSEPYDRIIIYLDRQYFERSMVTAGLLECFDRADRHGCCLLMPDQNRLSELEHTISEYEAAMEDQEPGAQAIRDTIMLQLLIRINRISTAQQAPSSDDAASASGVRKHTAAPASGADRLPEILTYINEHLQAELTVDTLASMACLSRYHFMRLFRSQTGTTVHAYIQQKRLLYAARLIRSGVPAIQAASDSGFGDYSAFSRAFRSNFGIRPSDLK